MKPVDPDEREVVWQVEEPHSGTRVDKFVT